MLNSSANAWHNRYMNEEDVDETTGLMSAEVVNQSYKDNDRSSRDRRPRRERENNENTDAVSNQAKVKLKGKELYFRIKWFTLYFLDLGWLVY